MALHQVMFQKEKYRIPIMNQKKGDGRNTENFNSITLIIPNTQSQEFSSLGCFIILLVKKTSRDIFVFRLFYNTSCQKKFTRYFRL